MLDVAPNVFEIERCLNLRMAICMYIVTAVVTVQEYIYEHTLKVYLAGSEFPPTTFYMFNICTLYTYNKHGIYFKIAGIINIR